ncbi:MAG: carbamoyltransferase HypF [Gammaproteobacteria bacterium]|nr:carbamoyltransferase HypF [Gammaproteobacteria bacterium]
MKAPVVSGGLAACENQSILKTKKIKQLVSLRFEKNTKQKQLLTSARKIILSGKVQGVGFRPFVYGLAKKHKLSGWVKNCMGTVEIFIQGPTNEIDKFIIDLLNNKPSLSEPCIESSQSVEMQLLNEFNILISEVSANSNISVPTDLFLCKQCLQEMNEPNNRRYLYPFINCTQCGPRYTLIKKLPYDRVNTSMAEFDLCAACKEEYKNPLDRRFHAEPVACANCGPSLSFKDSQNKVINNIQKSLEYSHTVLQQGKILAVKGIGGYHLMCDATSSSAIKRLRDNKNRPHKPLAIMFPQSAEDDFSIAQQFVDLSEEDKTFLLQPSRPILLVNIKTASIAPERSLPETSLSGLLAPGLNQIGMMLAYSPLHHLLLNKFNRPLVATSANLSGEPVLINNKEVEQRLNHVTDAFLHHNREIVRPADDPVYRTIANIKRPIRLGRGISPLEINLPFELKHPVLTLGAQMKNTITLAWGNRAVISPHIGEMQSLRSLQVFENTINDLQLLYNVNIKEIVCDAHSGYTTSRWAHKQPYPVHSVYHHHAHASAAYYESATQKDMIIFTWDGTGYGEDGTLWGGETLLGKPGNWKRVATMRPFNLPGGDKAGREPWRSAAAICWQTAREFKTLNTEANSVDSNLLKVAWEKKINSPQSSSVGRLFDAAAALCNDQVEVSYEGQAAMEFETLCDKAIPSLELPIKHIDNCYVTDWEPLIDMLLDSSITINQRSALFHGSLALNILHQANLLRDEYSIDNISFSGGVFQNKQLTECALNLLEENDFKVSLAKIIPLNDAGISFGQLIEYAHT